MRVEFRITSGARAGQREGFDQGVITIGRHAESHLRFDAQNDTDVSTKHAEIRVSGNAVTLVDLGSTNGTYVNGEQVHGERALAHGDVITFGAAGPKAELHAPEATTRARRDTSMRIAEAVEAQTGSMKKMVGFLAAIVVLAIVGAVVLVNRNSSDSRKQIELLVAQNDSLAKVFASLQGKGAALDAALATEKRRNDELSSRLAAARQSGDQTTITKLSAEMHDNASRQRGLVGAAQVDWAAVNARNAPAMAFIVADNGDEGNASGTGFNVSPSGLIVTNRHVVRDSKGHPSKRIVVKFENASAETKFKLAQVVKVSESDELAWLKLDGGGPYPTVVGVARAPGVRVGSPMALIGYPLGTGTAGMGGGINNLVPVSTMTLGAVSKSLADVLQLDVFAAQGSSGSPVFNGEGMVIGVLYGSPAESNGRIIYAVPSARLAAQMPADGAAIIR